MSSLYSFSTANVFLFPWIRKTTVTPVLMSLRMSVLYWKTELSGKKRVWQSPGLFEDRRTLRARVAKCSRNDINPCHCVSTIQRAPQTLQQTQVGAKCLSLSLQRHLHCPRGTKQGSMFTERRLRINILIKSGQDKPGS